MHGRSPINAGLTVFALLATPAAVRIYNLSEKADKMLRNYALTGECSVNLQLCPQL